MRASIMVGLAALLAIATGAVTAAPVVYEIEGYFVSRPGNTEEILPPTFSQAFPFTGSITVDMSRMEYDAEQDRMRADPIVAAEFRTSRDALVLTDNWPYDGGVISSRGSGTEGVSVWATLRGPDTGRAGTVRVLIFWHATDQGQLPSDLQQLDLSSLRPNAFRLSLESQDETCSPECVSELHQNVSGQITSLRKRGASPNSYAQDFSTTPTGWTGAQSGWTAASGYYANSQNSAFTSSIYEGIQLQDAFVLSSRLYSSWNASGNALGLVFNYRDSGNFYEVRFNALGTVTLNKVVNGQRSMLQTARTAPAHRVWFDVKVIRGRNQIRIDDSTQPIIIVDGATHRGGHAGVFASWNLARFDDLRLDQSTGNLKTSYSSFDTYTDGWRVVTGSWAQTGADYRNSSNLQASLTVPVTPIASSHYAIDALMYLEWSSSGNRGGLVYDFQDDRNYRAILLAPGRSDTVDHAGTLTVIEVRNGVRSTVAVASDPPNFTARQWCPLTVQRLSAQTLISGCGVSIMTLNQQPLDGPKNVGLIASWNLARFDEIVIGEFGQ